MSADRFCLAIDLGSGALKVGAVSLSGAIKATAERSLETERVPEGGAVQDASLWWDAVRELSRSVLSGIPAERVVAVACTGQWASTVPVDEAGEPVGPCLTWLDTRGARYSREVVGGPLLGYSPTAALAWIRRTAGIPSPNGGDFVSHMLLIERELPEVARAARWYLEPVDYLTMRFTGAATATFASMSGAWLTDNRRLDRLEYDPALLRRARVDASKLPPLVETGSLVGTVRSEVAAELGIDPAAQVVTGSPDLHSAALGTGAIEVGQPHMTITTTSWITMPFPRKKTDVMHSIATIPGLDASSYFVIDNIEAAGLCLRWLRETFQADGPTSFERLVELAAAAEPGSGGVIFTPWIAGERSPVDDRHARGGWHNLAATTSNAELIRSVLEGVAYNARWLNDLRREVRRGSARSTPHLRRGRRIRPLVPDPRRRHGPHHRARREAAPHQPAGRRPARGAGARGGPPRRSPRPRPGRPGLQPGSEHPGGIRPALRRVPRPLQGAAQDVRPPQRLSGTRHTPIPSLHRHELARPLEALSIDSGMTAGRSWPAG